MPKTVTVGQFTYNERTTTVTGPAEYMRGQGSAFLQVALEGGSVVVNFAMSQGQDPVVAVLVALQTDFATWRGLRQLTRRMRAN